MTRRSAGGLACLLGAAAVQSPARALRPPEFVTTQPGFSRTASGLQVRDASAGKGREVERGDRVVYSWEGCTQCRNHIE